MKLMIDTNVLLDVLLNRTSFADASAQVLKLCESNQCDGYLTASSITDIFYLCHRATHDKNAAYDAIGHVLNIAKICDVTAHDVLKAYHQKAPDFEDCLLATCAAANQCQYIITRNIRDYRSFEIPAITPDDFLNQYQDES